MMDRYPDNIEYITYENLMDNPESVLLSILEFLNVDVTARILLKALDHALMKTQPEKMKKVEKEGGFGGNLLGHYNSHMRGGAVGKWKQYLSSADVEYAAEELEKFGLCLAMFLGTVE